MLRAVCLVVAMAVPLPAFADRAEDLDSLYDALGLPDVIGIMREEGVSYGADLERELFPGRGGPGWNAMVEQIYDAEAMGQAIRDGLERGLEDEELDQLVEFFTSERGQRIIALEISARRAMVDEAIETAAEERLSEMRADADPRLELLGAFIEVNDLVDMNVMGALNSNYAFFQGMVDGGGMGGRMTEQQILADVWAQEPEIRQDTETWVWSYLALAYNPLEDSDIEAYVALSETEAGRALNTALFDGFDKMYITISRALGAGAAGFMAGEDI